MLKFHVLDNAEIGDGAVTLTYEEGDIANHDEVLISPMIQAGNVTVKEPTAAEIQKISANGSTVNCTAICSESGAKLICAAYNCDGKMIAIGTIDVLDDGTAHEYQITLETGTYQSVKAFLIGSSWLPLCDSISTSAIS